MHQLLIVGIWITFVSIVTSQGQLINGTKPPDGTVIIMPDERIMAATRTDSQTNRIIPLPDGRSSVLDISNIPTDRLNALMRGGNSATDTKIAAADRSASLLDLRQPHVDPIPPIDRRMSPLDPNVLIPDGRISSISIDGPNPANVRPNTLNDGRNFPSVGRISPIEDPMSLAGPRILPADGTNLQTNRIVSLPDGRSSVLDLSNVPTDRINALMGGGNSATDTKIAAVDRSASLPDFRKPVVDPFPVVDSGIVPIDRRMSAVERRISPIDPNVLIPIDGPNPVNVRPNTLNDGRNLPSDGRISPDGRLSLGDPGISPVGGTIPLADRGISQVGGTIPLADRGILPVGGKISLADRGNSPVGGTIPLADRAISPVDRRVSAVERNISPLGTSGLDRRVLTQTGGRLAIDGRLPSSGGQSFTTNAIYDDPTYIHNECVKAACSYPSLCYIPHPRTCFHFIMCRPLENGQIISTAMPCAFGTKWKPGFEPSCDRFDLVDCPADRCRHSSVTAYAHDDRNCRTYWKCVNGRSDPACCAKYHSFDPITKKCVSDIGCDSVCPLINDATCGAPGVRFANFADGNCRTHWDCENGHPHPVCCPAGQGFDVFRSECVPDPSCKDSCHKEYSESCLIPGTKSYGIVTDNNCRTYIKCNKYGQADPYCCLPGMMYDVRLKQCVRGVGNKCVNAICPYGHKEECKLEAVPGNPRVYKNLDAFSGIEMPCPVGTVFNASGCQCSPDLNPTTMSPPNVCTMAIHAMFPDLKNVGTAVAALLMIGDHGQGETGVGNMQSFWDGGDGINIPFYGSQSLIKMYLAARFRPTAGSLNKQVFVSSCNYRAGVPTFEVSLDQFQGTGGTIKLLAKSDGLPGVAEISAPYNFNDEILLRVIYDGTKIGLFIDSSNPAMSSSAVRPLTGQIAIHRGGLRFSHCRYENNVSGFIGYVAEIKFTKCLTKQMQNALDTVTTPIV